MTITTNEKKILVFVYGTLKRGHKNHQWMGDSKFVGEAIIKTGFRLYFDEFPCLVEEDSDCPVCGEVYEVSEATLVKLDELEEHPDWYFREQREVALFDKKMLVWTYLFPKRLLKSISIIESGRSV